MSEPTGAVRFHKPGGPDVLRWEPVTLDALGPEDACIKQEAIGVNFHDIYVREGLYPAPALPAIPGLEAAGVVEAVGKGVRDTRVGDRVAYATARQGAYAERRRIPAAELVPLPDAVSYDTAAALMIKGMTAQYLLRRTHRVKKGETILVHAAAGGVGLLLCQWAKHLGARVIGTVGSEEKAALVLNHGCDHPILYRKENFPQRVRDITKGEGVAVVYDSVGRDSFQGSLDCLKPLGKMVSFGQSSGRVPPFEILDLMNKGSLFLTRPTLFTHIAKREDLLAMAGEMFAALDKGVFKIDIRHSYPLREAARAQTALAARQTMGASILKP